MMDSQYRLADIVIEAARRLETGAVPVSREKSSDVTDTMRKWSENAAGTLLIT